MASIVRILLLVCLFLPTDVGGDDIQGARLQAYQDYWQAAAKKRFDQIVEIKIDALRSRATASNIAFPDKFEVRTTKRWGSPSSYLHRNLMVIPEEYLFRVISRSETLAIAESVMLTAFTDGDPEYGLAKCYFEILVQYDFVIGAQTYSYCTRDQRQKIADIRVEALNSDRDYYYSTLYFFFDEAVEMMLAHEAAHFALEHIEPKSRAVAHAQEYAADRHAKSLLDLVDVKGGSAPLLIIALGQPGLLSAGADITTDQPKKDFSTHPSPQCRAVHLVRESGGIAEVLEYALTNGDEIASFSPFIKLAPAFLPEINQILDQLECDIPE